MYANKLHILEYVLVNYVDAIFYIINNSYSRNFWLGASSIG